jgi:hypothetical protein
MSGNRHLFLFYFRFSLDFAFLCDILCADKAERSHTMTTEEKIKGLEHLLRKCTVFSRPKGQAVTIFTAKAQDRILAMQVKM